MCCNTDRCTFVVVCTLHKTHAFSVTMFCDVQHLNYIINAYINVIMTYL